MTFDYKLTRYERYFRDPTVGENILRIGISNQACRNIRMGLNFLGYHLPNSDSYDKLLEDAVRGFQQDNNHLVHDGCVGPGTRTLLAQKLLEKGGGRHAFSLMKYPAGQAFPLVFLSYAHEDVKSARRIYKTLSESHVRIWFDKESLLAGENWKLGIESAIKTCRFFLALLSNHSVNHVGYVQTEMKKALEVYAQYPPSQIFLIPVRLEACVPSEYGLGDLQWVDMFPNWKEGITSILKTIALQD